MLRQLGNFHIRQDIRRRDGEEESRFVPDAFIRNFGIGNRDEVSAIKIPLPFLREGLGEGKAECSLMYALPRPLP